MIRLMTDTPTNVPSASVVAKYFGKRPGTTVLDFKTEYQALTETDKRQLTTGIQNGTLTY